MAKQDLNQDVEPTPVPKNNKLLTSVFDVVIVVC